MPNFCAKFIVGGALTYALYLIVKCPCDKLIACHSEPYWFALGVAAVTVPLNNYLQLK